MLVKCFLLWALHVFPVCTAAFHISPMITIRGRSSDTAAGLKQAASILSVPSPGNWATYMNPPTTTGSKGAAQVGSETIESTVARWAFPREFHSEAISSIRLLVLAASEGSDVAQAFQFKAGSGASLTTLLVAVKRLELPTDPNTPVALQYVTINTNTVLHQLYTRTYRQKCRRCSKCVWFRKCCCDQIPQDTPRGLTLEESALVQQKLAADQFIWFNQQDLSSRRLTQLSLSNKIDNNTSLAQAIENYLSNNQAKSEVLKYHNDPIVTALQSNIVSLKLASRTLKIGKVDSQRVPTLLTAFAKDYGFDGKDLSEKFNASSSSPRFSYENLFTKKTNHSQHLSIQYVWICWQNLDNNTYAVHALNLKISSEMLLNQLLSNHTNSSEMGSFDQPITITRTSRLINDGIFSNEDMSTLVTPWETKTTRIVMNILRFIGASAFVPKEYRMLSQFSPEVIFPDGKDSNNLNRPTPRAAPAIILAVGQSITTLTSAWKSIVSAFKSSSSTTIQRVVRFGFSQYHQRSRVLKAVGIPADKVEAFTRALIIDYSLPPEDSLALSLEYSDDMTWSKNDYLYSPKRDSEYRYLSLLKNGDSTTNKASFIIVDIKVDFELAPDLLLIHKTKSKLGGIWEKTTDSIEHTPHALNLQEALQLEQFFQIIAIGKLAATLGLNVSYPAL